MKRKLASVQTISDIQPIEGADRIEVVSVLGWKCVAKKGEFHRDSRSHFPYCQLMRNNARHKSATMSPKFLACTSGVRPKSQPAAEPQSAPCRTAFPKPTKSVKKSRPVQQPSGSKTSLFRVNSVAKESRRTVLSCSLQTGLFSRSSTWTFTAASPKAHSR